MKDIQLRPRINGFLIGPDERCNIPCYGHVGSFSLPAVIADKKSLLRVTLNALYNASSPKAVGNLLIKTHEMTVIVRNHLNFCGAGNRFWKSLALLALALSTTLCFAKNSAG